MRYTSTRDKNKSFNSADVIKAGISPDKGLFVPEHIPHISNDSLNKLVDMSYVQRAIEIIKLYLTDFNTDEISECVMAAYNENNFDNPHIAPLFQLNNNTFLIELWHGPTCAFKDMALQILPHLLVKSIKKTSDDNKYIILVATSGDTGKAALEGFADVEGTGIIVFYPDNGVSNMQKLQMVTQEGSNVSVIGVVGNFDDAQTGVKNIFNDTEFNETLNQKDIKLSSANSINWGRLLPQIVYYISSYVELVKDGKIRLGDIVNVAVPTGNFGNILAAYYAREMGLPIAKLICASNINNVLTDFINTGIYDRRRELKKTISPSMDILISSNLERLLYHLTGGNDVLINDLMNKLADDGIYRIDSITLDKLKSVFFGGYADDIQSMKTIKDIYDKCLYVLDPHTSVAVNVLENYREQSGDDTTTLVASTASPFKFPESVLTALNIPYDDEVDEFTLLQKLSDISGKRIPANLKKIENLPIRHREKCKKDEMKDIIKRILL